MIRKALVLNFLLVIAITGIAQTNPLDQYLEQLQKSHIMPGFSVVVVQGEEVVFLKGYGTEYADENRPMTAATSTAVGSLTKSFTSLAVMQLAEEQKIDLDQPVVTYLPWFRTANKTLSDKITVRMLINNTSGLRSPQVRNREISDKAIENLVRSFESVYLTNEPGTSYEYSNEGFALAGLLIQEVTGMPYDRYLEEFIFNPLEMDRTTNDSDEFSKLHVLYGHYHGISSAIPVHSEEELLREFSPAGSMMRSSATDLGNYLLALLNGGKFRERQVITAESIGVMWEPNSSFPGISVEDGGEELPFHYGLGWFVGELGGKEYIFHGGNRRNMSSMTFICPEKNIGAILLANIDLTLIDKYAYPNLITLLNNIIRLSLGEDASDYAIPVVSDPTLNTYELLVENEQKYLGEYRLTKGKDWVYLGTRLYITRGANGLEGEIRKGEQVIERFALDFVTQKTAVSRNLSLPRSIHFKFLSGGEISDLYIGDRKYSRITEEYHKKYGLLNSSENEISFHFPRDWNIIWEDLNFEGSNSSSENESIRGRVFEAEKEPEAYFQDLFPDHQVIHTGLHLSEIYGNYHWQELAIVSSNEGSSYQHLLCVTKREQANYVIVLTTQDNLTRSTISVIPTLLGTFAWRE
ncbi:MAG: beta-lactamase family protein [Bacteroidales bacterium]|nr:beta-lactamase family protein [Bacteroidales bacterium]